MGYLLKDNNHKCNICGRDNVQGGYKPNIDMVLCNAHASHYEKYGRFFNIRKKENMIIKKEGYIEIILENMDGNKVGSAIIDNDDYHKIKNRRWSLSNNGYVSSDHRKDSGLLHHIILGRRKGLVIDHINRDKLDNRKCNLRFTTYGSNNFNKSGILGVWKIKNKWKSSINKDRVKYYLGTFSTEEAAIEARKKKEVELYGFEI